MHPDYVDAVRTEMDQLAFDTSLPHCRRHDTHRPVLIAVVQNEFDHLPNLLNHHRTRGIQAFVILDNGSSDDSLEYLRAQDDVEVISVERPFSWQAKQAWIMRVIESIGFHRWYLVVDADERVVFPGDHRYSFADLTADMELEGKWRIRGMLVDMYGPGPLLQPPERPLERSQTFFDGDGYREETTHHLNSVKGGPRHRALSTDEIQLDPELTKYPLFRLAPGELMANPHHHWPYEENFKSPCHLGILHYKFGPELQQKIESAIASGNYWNQSIEYRAYQAALKANPDLSLAYGGSRRYRRPKDLVKSGLLADLDWKKWRKQRWQRKQDELRATVKSWFQKPP